VTEGGRGSTLLRVSWNGRKKSDECLRNKQEENSEGKPEKKCEMILKRAEPEFAKKNPGQTGNNGVDRGGFHDVVGERQGRGDGKERLISGAELKGNVLEGECQRDLKK